ncbi:MAG TPA: hypothetical protein VNQ90_01395 [Chthoniobacteraceae bacterium]|nr:hypothetical protein [Chthoniobacteraceae bacterium]
MMNWIYFVLIGASFASFSVARSHAAAKPPEAPKTRGEAAAEERPLSKFEKGFFLEKHPEWLSPEPEAIRALVAKSAGRPAVLVGAARELIAAGRNDSARILLNAVLESVPENATVTRDGAKAPVNLLLREATLAHALRYQLEPSPGDLEATRRLLLGFAGAMPYWPLKLNRTGKAESNWVAQDHPRIYQQFGSGGLWGQWYHLDLRGSYPLLQAYDLTAGHFSADERRAIEEGLFLFQVGLIERWPEIYHNTIVYKLDGLLRYGLVLHRPELIHRAVGLIIRLFHIGFSPDGFWQEGTPAYHRQVASRMTGSFPALLKGYSDPPGWRHPQTGKRFDDLDLEKTFGAAMARIRRSQEKITLPDGYIAALNDTDPDYYTTAPKSVSRAELLGTSGYAVLGSGRGEHQQQLYLNYSGTFGHEHYDANAIHWYALGTRLVDETRYRPIQGSDSSRAWSSNTYAHQTVVIDEANQPGSSAKPQRAFTQDDAIEGVVEWPLRKRSAGTRHMGDLLLFDGSREALQAVEVEGKKAYGGKAGLYRRTILKVDLGGGEGYLVDFFRVKGGNLHDYMLHGPLALPYRAEFSVPLAPASGSLGPKNADPYYYKGSQLPRYIDLVERGEAAAPWQVTFTAENGIGLRSWMVCPHPVEILSGTAPAINRLGDAPFVAVRQGGGESFFIAVHEAYRGKPQLHGARLLASPENAEGGVVLEIDLGERRHRVFSTLGAERSVTFTEPGGESVLNGRLGWLEMEEGKVARASLWDGTRLAWPGGEVQQPRPAFEGEVTGTLRREAGDAGDAVRVAATLPTDGSLVGRIVHVDLGGELTWSYRIEKVEADHAQGQEEGSLLHLEHDPGFSIDPNGLAKMLYHPGWGTRKGVTFRIPLQAGLE